MKFKNILSIALSATMLLSMAGCQQQAEPEPSITSLSLMEEINTKNIIDGSGDMRVWYQVNPSLFTRTDGEPGTLNNVSEYLSYLSDGDMKTIEEDLNLSGILLTNLVNTDDASTTKEFAEINPALGTNEDLAALCQKANSLGMPVMLSLDMTSISPENSQFIALQELINGLQEGEDPMQKDPVLMGEFYVEKDKAEENWVQIGNSPYYYLALPQSTIPRINLDSHVWRQFIITAIEHYFSLGVSGFCVQDYNNLHVNDEQKNADFMKWFDSICKERKPDCINVFQYSSWNDVMGEIPAYAADTASAGAEGMIAKAVTGAISAKDLGNYFESNTNKTQNMTAYFINNDDGSLDLLKSDSRIAQYKMALALELMLNGQVFITAGDELGLTSDQADLIVDAIAMPTTPEEESSASGDLTGAELTGQEASQAASIDLQFGNLAQQKENGNSILNFVIQAIALRDSYRAITEAPTTVSQELSTDTLLVVDRKAENSETVLVFNLSDGSQSVDLSQMQISGLPAELGGVLLTGVQNATIEGQTLTLPPYSMILLK
ncbi:hypothetical protein IM774_12235 [Erysipelotrichaceae bacterium RD49]|nr:hypothetical protein [Erysipelotrichaceae bacterium RD49]